MTADQADVPHRILSFAAQIGRCALPPEVKARRRGWLDGTGAHTPEGHELLDHIGERVRTRTVFRGL
ncbi:hypothetical protein [Jannaschia seohaensis]|uniref:Uncharacterized protein n=1 Tax=Jannaschia seohaensis TaxID=475081 RepID=A0A2Y9C877_9RHOB|nr:hypothetical protein [Jannaschia seohaensis]PWJ16924.1 hypothetical protein BCF38_10736 [Jannaschia seohaensis]SSA48133.1 hypothetical protein SAMN05421539_10736 [Jannaschia seohaensis]